MPKRHHGCGNDTCGVACTDKSSRISGKVDGYIYIKAVLLITEFTPVASLVGGSVVFGVGWGIAGFCPGGALPVLGTGDMTVVSFVAALLVGIVLTRQVENKIYAKKLASTDGAKP